MPNIDYDTAVKVVASALEDAGSGENLTNIHCHNWAKKLLYPLLSEDDKFKAIAR